MRGLARGFGAVLRLGAIAAVLAASAPGAARSDGNPEEALTQTAFGELTAIAPAPGNEVAAAAPVNAHNFTEAEREEMGRMHAVRVFKGKQWKRLSPEEREARVRGLRVQMPDVSLILTVPDGELWAVPAGEDNANFKDIIDRHVIRLWTPEEKAAMPVAVGNGPSRNDGSNDLGSFARAPAPEPKQEP